MSGPSVNIRGVRDLPATPASWFALCAAPYFERFGAGREQLAQIAVKNHANGCLGAEVLPQEKISVEDALNARLISWPFRLYDCTAQTDGAAAVIITRRELAKTHRQDRAALNGSNA